MELTLRNFIFKLGCESTENKMASKQARDVMQENADSDEADDCESISDAEATDQETQREQNAVFSSSLSRKRSVATTYKVKFKSQWKESYPIRAVQRDTYKFNCIPCGRNILCHHQGLGDVKRHCLRDSHKANEASMKKQRSINFKITSEADSLKMKLTKAEVMVTNFIVQHNLPLATADHLGALFKVFFLTVTLPRLMQVEGPKHQQF